VTLSGADMVWVAERFEALPVEQLELPQDAAGA
jgi:hypothetical protein